MGSRMDPLEIGNVIAVEGDNVDVQISVETLLLEYHGKNYRVGRLGTFVTIPMDRRTLIGYITKVGYTGDLEPGPYPGSPTRIIVSCQLLGTIEGDRFRRGVNEYPTLGDKVRLGVDEDFELIFGAFDALADADGLRKAFSIGRFAVDTDFEVQVLGKEFFAKHVAVMGNSGSGKSCTTAKILHEALQLPHAQVVLFDMHGEYLRAFSDDDGNPLPNVTYLSDRNLILPYWMLAYEEFDQLFVDDTDPANLNAQRVFLREALEQMKLSAADELGLKWEMTIDTPVYYDIGQLKTYAQNMNDARYVLNTESFAFSHLQYRSLPPEEQMQLLLTRRMRFNPATSEGEVPHATYFGKLLGFINQVETKLNDRRYDFLLRPFEQLERNDDLRDKLNPKDSPGAKSMAVSWVIRQMLGQMEPRKNLTIVDLSGLPFDVVDITVAVLTRALFDFNFWSPVDMRQPVLLVYEEAHNYLPRKAIEGRKTFARQAAEKVAKEGRKYGVSAMIVSQRPSEISETILSQCNSMVLMRMNNPDDQEYAARVVSDQFRSLINLLPSMKPGEGFVIGDAVLMPMRTLIEMPPKEPQSANMDFFSRWSFGADQEASQNAVEQIIDRWWRQERSALESKAPAATEPDPSGSEPEPIEEPLASEAPSSDSHRRSADEFGGPEVDVAVAAEALAQHAAEQDDERPGEDAAAAAAAEPSQGFAQRKLSELARMLAQKKRDDS